MGLFDNCKQLKAKYESQLKEKDEMILKLKKKNKVLMNENNEFRKQINQNLMDFRKNKNHKLHSPNKITSFSNKDNVNINNVNGKRYYLEYFENDVIAIGFLKNKIYHRLARIAPMEWTVSENITALFRTNDIPLNFEQVDVSEAREFAYIWTKSNVEYLDPLLFDLVDEVDESARKMICDKISPFAYCDFPSTDNTKEIFGHMVHLFKKIILDGDYCKHFQILEMRYFDGKNMTLEEIGKHYGITRERVRQICKRDVDKITNCLTSPLYIINNDSINNFYGFLMLLSGQQLMKIIRYSELENGLVFNFFKSIFDKYGFVYKRHLNKSGSNNDFKKTKIKIYKSADGPLTKFIDGGSDPDSLRLKRATLSNNDKKAFLGVCAALGVAKKLSFDELYGFLSATTVPFDIGKYSGILLNLSRLELKIMLEKYQELNVIVAHQNNNYSLNVDLIKKTNFLEAVYKSTFLGRYREMPDL